MKDQKLDGNVSEVRENENTINHQQVSFEQDGGAKVGGTGGIENRTPHRVDENEAVAGESAERRHSL